MATVRTVTVKSAGGDYTSLASAEAGEQGDLVSLDRQLNIECYASAAGDSTQVTVSGWTTDATRYIDIYCPEGERHAGVWDAAKYHLSVTTSGSPGGVITLRELCTRVRYLQVRNLRATPPAFNQAIYGDTDGNFLIDGCITRGGNVGIGVSPVPNQIRNCICYETPIGANITGTASGVTEISNSTLIGTTTGLNASASVNFAVANNVYAHGGTAGFAASGGQAPTRTNCMSSDTSATAGTGGTATNCTNSVAHDTSNFVNVTSGSEDYHLVTGSALIDAGVDLSGTFTNDIDGTTRPQNSVFDVGADEFVAAAAGQPAWKRYGGIAFAASGYQPGTGSMRW